jgi:hypothetical protein
MLGNDPPGPDDQCSPIFDPNSLKFCSGDGISRFMAFSAHSDGFFAMASFTTVHLLLAMMAMLSLSLMKFKYTLNLAASVAIESQMMCLAPCNSHLPLNLVFILSTLSCKA